MRLVGDYLHRRGCTISAPLLPGHGSTVDDMNRRKWDEWTGCVEKALADLQARCETVFIGGLSMGAVLTLYLAAQHPELPGIVIYSPAMWPANRLIYLTPIFKYLIRKQSQSGIKDLTDPGADLRLWSYEENPAFAAHELLKLVRHVRRALPRIAPPLLVIHSTLDSAIHPDSAKRTYEQAGSADKELVTLYNSGHCITVDSEWESVADKTFEFIQAHQ